MKRFSFGSLRVRLIILVLLATIPALGLTLYTGLEQHQIAADKAKDNAQSLAHFVSNRQKQFIEGAHQFLHILAQLPQVRSYDTAACSRLFNDLLNQYPHYLNIGAIGLDGYIFASAIPLNKPIYVADRPYFQRVLKTKKFTVGVYQIGRITGKPGVNLGYPVMDDIGKVKAVVFVALDLTWLNKLSGEADLPDDSTLSLIDSESTILARYPEPEKWVGKTMPEASVVKTILAKGKGIIETIGADGVKRLYALTSFGSTMSQVDKVYVSIGIPSSAVFVQVNRILIRNLAFLLFISLLALSAAWFGGNLLVLRQLNPIVSTAKRLGAGDLSARTGIVYGKGELSQLASTFDEMAESLEKHEAERKKAEEALKESEEKYRLVVENAGDAILIAQGGMIRFVNSKAMEILGYSYDEFISRPFVEFIHPEDRMTVLEYHLKRIKGKGLPGIYSFRMVDKDGNTKWLEINAVSITWHEKPATLNFLRDVTERKQAEEALRESEDRYRDLVEHSHDLLCTHDLEGKLLSVNPAVIRIGGYSKDELLGMNFGDFLAPEVRGQFGNYLTEIQAKGAASGVMLVQTKGGEKRLWEYHNTLRTEGIATPIVRGMARDITEHKKAEEALKDSENRYRTLVENSNDGIALVKGDVHLYANQKFLEIFGYNHIEEIVGKPISITVHPDDKGRVVEMVRRRQTKEGGASKYEFKGIRKDGGVVYIEVAATQTTYQGEAVSLSYHRDITDRKKAEEALRSNEEKYRTILENIEDGYFEVDVAGNFTFYNDSLCSILGYSKDEMIGMNNRQYTDQENAKKLFQAFNKVYRTGEPAREFDWEIIRKDGAKRSIEASVSLIKDSSGNRIGFRGIVRDITDRKRAEEEKATLQEQLRQSQKIEAIGRLAGGIAHDFNNLLTVIKGYSQLSLIELKEDVPLRGNIEEIKRASDKAADLTRQLLAFSRRQILEMRVLDLNTVLRDMDKMLHRLIGEDIELITLLADDLGRVKTDPGWVEQVIMNLAVNARDAMPSVGKLTIETANVELDGAYARNHIAVTPGRYVMLSVSDTGVGMAPEVRQQVFEPFFTTKEKGKGTGLGLSTVYGIVKQSGGNIWVYSEPGQGTTFKIYLPRVDEPLGELKEKVVKEKLPRGSETILLVEDEEVVRKLAVRILKRQGYTVLEGSHGNEAIDVCKQHKGPVHLLLTDVVMPGMSGRELAERFKPLYPKMKVLYMSGYTDNAITHHGVLEEGMNYLQKPFTVDGLARKVREVLDK